MKKIVLILPVLSHYNEDVFKTILKSDILNFVIIGGDKYENIKSIKGNEYHIFKNISFRIFGHTFYYLKGAINFVMKEKPDGIMSSGIDFHNLHIILIFLLTKTLFRKKFYWWSHGTFGHQGKIGIFLRKYFYSCSDGVLAYSKKGKENLLSMGIENEKIQVINNSIVLRDYGFLNHDIFGKGQFEFLKILFCGRITKKAKVDLLINALSNIQKQNKFIFKCIIVGDGEVQPLIDLVKKLNLHEEIEFVGSKYGPELDPFFMKSNLFVYPGGIGLSIVHCLSFGLPVITTGNEALHMPEVELLIPDKTGDFYDDSISDLSNKIIKWESKLRISQKEIRFDCVQVIKDFGYFPDVVSNLMMDYIKRDFRI